MVKDTLVSPRRVDPRLAREVAGSLIAARSTPRDPKVRAAYGQLEQQSDRAFMVLTRNSRLGGVHMVFTRCRMPYASDREMVAAVRTDRLREVITAATERHHRHPLMGCQAGGAFDRFRAVHDIVGHVFPGSRLRPRRGVRRLADPGPARTGSMGARDRTPRQAQPPMEHRNTQRPYRDTARSGSTRPSQGA